MPEPERGPGGPRRDGPHVELREGELAWRFSRSSGPGGQHADTADTRVSLSLDVAATQSLGPQQRDRALSRLSGRLRGTVLTVTVEEHRSQARNRDLARERLIGLLSWAAAPGPRSRRPTRPTRGSTERRLASKKRRGQVKRMRGRGGEE